MGVVYTFLTSKLLRQSPYTNCSNNVVFHANDEPIMNAWSTMLVPSLNLMNGFR